MKMVNRTSRKLNRQRRGFVSMELVLTLPILMVVLFGLFEFSLLFFARGNVVDASRAGARTATLPGVTEQEIEDEIRKVLDPDLQEAMQLDIELGQHSGDVVAVTVQVPMHNASPDLLWPIGYSLEDRYLVSETRMIKE